MCLFMVSSPVAQKEPERRSEAEKQAERRLKKTERDKRDGESKRRVTSFYRLGESGSVDS